MTAVATAATAAAESAAALCENRTSPSTTSHAARPSRRVRVLQHTPAINRIRRTVQPAPQPLQRTTNSPSAASIES